MEGILFFLAGGNITLGIVSLAVYGDDEKKRNKGVLIGFSIGILCLISAFL